MNAYAAATICDVKIAGPLIWESPTQAGSINGPVSSTRFLTTSHNNDRGAMYCVFTFCSWFTVLFLRLIYSQEINVSRNDEVETQTACLRMKSPAETGLRQTI
jgi:hypothetical protein